MTTTTCTCPCHRGAGHHHRGAGLDADPCPRCGVTDPNAYQPTYCARCGWQTGPTTRTPDRTMCIQCHQRGQATPCRYGPPNWTVCQEHTHHEIEEATA